MSIIPFLLKTDHPNKMNMLPVLAKPDDDYENILEYGKDILTSVEELTFVREKSCICPEFRRTYISKCGWTVGNIISHTFKLTEDCHNGNFPIPVDLPMTGFCYIEDKNEIHILYEID